MDRPSGGMLAVGIPSCKKTMNQLDGNSDGQELETARLLASSSS